MEYIENVDMANTYARQAMARLKKLDIPMSPNFYELWYVYYSGQNQALMAEVDSYVKASEAITSDICQELFLKYLDQGNSGDIVAKAGERISTTIDQVSDMMRDVKQSTEQYGETLSGANSVFVETDDIDELKKILAHVTKDTERMIKQNRDLEKELDRSSDVIADMQKDLESVRKEAVTDGLTGLANRKSFDEKIEYIRQKSDEEEQVFTLLMIDIDHFKSFNDTYGHQVGDQVLRLVGKTLIDGIKGKDFAARYGGEEFSIILPDSNSRAGEIVGNSLREAVAKKEVINRNTGKKLGRITMSVGIAQYNGGETSNALIGRADQALYKAKETGRNRVVIDQ